MVNVLSSMKAANILSSGGGGAVASVSPADVLPAAGVPTVSGSFPTVSAIFTTASVEQIDAQLAREMKEEFARENQRLSEQLARDSEIARLHAEEELKIMIEGLDRSNEVIAKHLSEYEQAEADLSVGEKIELISELMNYQDHRAKILKYQAQQSKPLSKKEQREFYMSKQFEDFVPMSSKEASERVKRQGLKIDQGSSKRMKISEGASKEELKGMMQLVPLEEVYIEALQVKHPIIDWEIHSKGKRDTKQATRDKEKEMWVELKRLFEPDFNDQLWTHHQAFMHDPLDWKLYDTCGVHHVSTKDQEIFMLVENDYPLRKGLATVMIIQDEELIEASSPELLTDQGALDKYMGVWFRSEVPDTVEICSMAVIFCKQLQEIIESRSHVIDHLEKVRGYPTQGWLKRLKENHAEDLKQLGFLHPKLKEENQWKHYLDLRLAREINALCARLTDVIDERENFIYELNVLVGSFVPEKMAEFMKEIQEFIITNDETIDCAFAIFNTIITSLKALDESFSSRNHVRKFLRALPTKWHPKITAIEESKDLSTLPLDELIDNLKLYKVVLEKDLEIFKSKKEKYKSLAFKAREVLSEEHAISSDSDDEE
uniref:UBN2 domain-containing protein n=1 Tax=Tanacetum cinerariifolium TaxID=118510 RepID=A0A6L2NR54_TANCI|nr:UBN2 domain-containing protein [Tanacetum cinerariifolium]